MKNITIVVLITIAVIGGFYFFNNSNKDVDLKYGSSVNVSSYESVDTSKSSFVKSARYKESDKHLILNLSGSSYEYCDVPLSIWNSFKRADSFGTYYNSQIKGRYSCN